MQALLLLNLICPFVLILVGVLLKKFPVSDMSRHNGYNTPISRKSQEHWDYAQTIAPDICITFGKYLFVAEIIISVLLLLLRVSIGISLAIGETIGFISLFLLFYYTDSKIEEKFRNI